jgi:hypothetical protein
VTQWRLPIEFAEETVRTNKTKQRKIHAHQVCKTSAAASLLCWLIRS